MSKSKPSPTPGIEERHARACAAPSGRCSCNPTYRPWVWDPAAGKKLYPPTPVKTKTAAKHWRTDALSAVRAGEVSADRGPVLRDAVQRWLEGIEAGLINDRSGKPFKPSSVRGYRHCMEHRVLPVLGHLRVDEVRPRDVQLLVDGLVEAKLSPATIDSAVTPLRAFYRRATTRGEAKTNPALRIEKPGVRKKDIPVVDPATVEAMLGGLDGMDRALWAIAFYAGLRRGELAALRWEDVDLATSVIRVEHGWDVVEGEIAPKSSEGRRKIPLSVLLRDYLDPHHLGTGRVFQSMRWVAGSNDRAREVWKAAKMPEDLTLHSARHVYASMAIAAGINVKAVSVFMGHANIKITLDTYGHLLPGSEAEAATLFDAYLARSVGGSTVPPTVPHPAEIQQ